MQDIDNRVGFPLTIERQLERYYLNEKHTERHKVLWHTWNQNKRWITQILEITICSYPSYSKHDESHAQSVLHNIEMILGEDRIAELSASDCFVLLHTVYIHDIGMCITHQDRVDILNNRAFIDMIQEMDEEGEGAVYLRKAIDALQKTTYNYDNNLSQMEKAQKLYLDKLEVYYGLIHLIGDFRREEHGEKAKERLYDWTIQSDKLGSGFSLAGMPQRIFLTIANCAKMHTHPDFDAIMELPKEDGGYASDYIHPRFISVLLQLGDILDMDNNRFHPLMQMCMGNVPEPSQLHYEKHISIRKLHITPNIIEIEADCETQEALRLVRKECDMLRGILKEAGYSWSVICPPEYRGSLPTVGSVNLYMKGEKIPAELVTTQFLISQEKAFSILQGANVYSGQYVFLREFLQNAVDATKIQYWNDCVSTYGNYKEKGIIKGKSPYQLEQYVSTDNYPIEIELELQKKMPEGAIRDITRDDIENLDKGKETDCIYGVKVRIKDFGTGIDKDSILNISKVGNSRRRERELIESMPEWLRPTAEFGIGLQSVFLLVGSFHCYTHTRSGERYEITFGSGASSRYEGYINVKPTSLEDDTFGTCFEIFVPCDKKRLHQNCCEAWDGKDPFSEKYDNRRPLRHAAELAAQMAIYLDSLIGELLFPVHLSIRKLMGVDIPINTTADNKIDNICFSWMPDKEEVRRGISSEEDNTGKESDSGEVRPWIKNKKSWIFYKKGVEADSTIMWEELGQDIFLLDFKSSRLHIWSGKVNSLLVLSAKNLIKREEMSESYEKADVFNGTKIYYKGIELQVNAIQEDNDFIEYIDIKGDLKRELLNLNRKGFTEKGEKYFTEVINTGLQESIKNVLKYLANKQDKTEYVVAKIAEQIEQKVFAVERGKKEVEELKRQIISTVILVYLASLNEYNELAALGIDRNRIDNGWDVLIKTLNKKLIGSLGDGAVHDLSDQEKDGIEKWKKAANDLKENSQFFNILTYSKNVVRNSPQNALSFADLFDRDKKFALLQIRDDIRGLWHSYLIQIEEDDSICDDIRELVLKKEKQERKKLYKRIDAWGERIFQLAKNRTSDEKDYRQQFLMDWIIRNIPTVAMFSDETGNKRINVLSSEIYPFIYLNDKFKWLIIQRMIEENQKKKIDRFSTIAWQSREFLACTHIPFAAYFVKRGKFAEQSYYKVIFPISGSWLSKLKLRVEKVQELQLVTVMKQALEMIDIRKYLQREITRLDSTWQDEEGGILERLKKEMHQSNIFQSIYEFYMDLISLCIENNESIKAADNVDRKFLNERLNDKDRWHDIFLKITEIYLNSLSAEWWNVDKSKKEVMELQNNEEFKSICLIFAYFKENYWEISLQGEVREILQLDKVRDRNREQIIAMIKEKSIYPIPEDNIRISYSEFETEILELFVNNAYEKVQKDIRERVKLLNVV